MRRAAPALCVLAIGLLTGCDDEAGSCSSSPAAASLEAPERPRFGGRPGEAERFGSAGESSPGDAALHRRLAGYAGPAPASSASGDRLGRLVSMPGRLFDGSREASGPGEAPPAALGGSSRSRSRSGDRVPDHVAGGGSLIATFRRRASDSTPVPVYRSGPGGPLVFESGMTIDTDGRIADPGVRARVERQDPHHQGRTSLTYATGRSLDPTVVPYIVLPTGFGAAQTGDLALVEYRGRTAYAVVGDRGPATSLGEGSVALAEALGIDSHGGKGGVSGGVRYTVFPGSGSRSPRSEGDLLQFIRYRGRAVASRIPTSIDL